MPLATLHLISLDPSTSLVSFVHLLQSLPEDQKPIIISKVIRWIITPELIDTNPLLHPKRPYELLFIIPITKPLPSNLTSKINDHFHLQIGIPSRLLKDFKSTNTSLLHPNPTTIPALTGALSDPLIQPSSQSLSLSPSLQTWITKFSRTPSGENAVSMLNLLSFIPDRKSSYLQYGQSFAKSIGSKRGGNAKLVGHTVYPPPPSQTAPTSIKDVTHRWDEFALAHYPSIMHFADMLASRDYQEVNQKYRVPSLKDTCILCTSEVEIEELMGAKNGKAKL